ncbi:sodium- and chloride-dependent glycine transporter 1-like [Haliotis rubra]|uniref:sodium- and chloride-dependent glycine transporter 1-like n=1 Tax=Haliotis rubra TaxID=36100 RepID=UPI001EE62D33|nr:sodium- and chloride-dependent glycine transporter 1-like [Haliotis rubra]
MAHQQWRSQLDYIVTLLGFSVGSGTFIKFPFYCMRNGGGIGVGCVVCSWMFFTYYNVLFAWITYYFYNSFSSHLPWEHCDNAWNTPGCIPVNHSSTLYNITGSFPDTANLTSNSTPGMSAAEEFWRFQTLKISDGLHSLGGIRWHLAVCLIITNIILFLWIFQGIKVSGKLVYVTVGVPYILITVFLIRGSLLPGSADGMAYYIYPRFEKLRDPKVWVEACSYALYSMGVASGCIITMSGHNRINNNCFR